MVMMVMFVLVSRWRCDDNDDGGNHGDEQANMIFVADIVCGAKISCGTQLLLVLCCKIALHEMSVM